MTDAPRLVTPTVLAAGALGLLVSATFLTAADPEAPRADRAVRSELVSEAMGTATVDTDDTGAGVLAHACHNHHGADLQPDDVTIELQEMHDGIYMLTGQGGNIGVCAGNDGTFMIDSQFAPLTERIREAIDTVSEGPIRFLVNTHLHGDHTGGNENLGRTGTVIVAHDQVRARLAVATRNEAFGRTTPPQPAVALPVITFAESLTFHWNDQTIRVIHVANAHTDGDAFVVFEEANVVHAGDIHFNGLYPFIDYSVGGHIEGMIAAVDVVLAQCDADTKIIPGHGPAATPDDLRSYRAMLVTVADRVRAQLEAGATVEAIVASKPTADLDAVWGNGFFGPDQFVSFAAEGMKRHGSVARAGR